ncbi:ankyrin, partial [Backusella circina FSU 941]
MDERSQRTPKENLLKLTQKVSNEDLRQALRSELKCLVDEYDRLVSMLQQRSEILEQEYESLQFAEDSYQQRYEKAVREMQFFKKKYDKASELNKQYASLNGGRPRSPSLESSASSLESTQRTNPLSPKLNAQHPYLPTSPPASSVSGSELSNSIHHTPPPPIPSSPESKSSNNTWNSYALDSLPPPPPRIRNNSTIAHTVPSVHSSQSSSTDGQQESNKNLQNRKGSLQSPSDPTVTLLRTTTSSGIKPSVIQQRRVDPIAFGGSDPLWETIAKSKGTDSGIDKLISNFLKRGGSPNTAKQSSSQKHVKYGYGMIHSLIAIKALSALEILLQQGANPNAMTLSQVEDDKVTPVYLAASMGWLPGLQLLVEAGADLISSRGGGLKNKTVLHVAAEHCHISVVEYIISQTPPKFHLQVDSMGASVLHYACASGHTDLVSLLVLGCHLPVEQADIRGEVPLHWASRHGHLEVASLLIERCGCDFNYYVPRKVGTPFDIAKAGNHKRLVEYYKKIGALTGKKMDKKREEELEKEVPVHLQSALSKNGLFSF